MKEALKKYKRRLVFCLCLLLLIFASYEACKMGRTDLLCDTVGDRVLKPVLGFIPSLLPFSLFEWLVAAAVIIVLSYLISLICALVKKKKKLDFFIRKASAGILAVLIVALLFMLSFGTYYYKEPLSKKLGLKSEGFTAQQLYLTTKAAALRLNEAGAAVNRDGDGLFSLAEGKEGTLQNAQAAYDAASTDYPFLTGHYPAPKGLIISPLMNYLFINGIYFPLTVEANVNMAGHNLFFPAAILHEMAHQRGIAREDEANYLAYAVGRRSKNPDFVYSGYALAYLHLANALYAEDKELFYEVNELLSDEVRRDFSDYNDFYSRYITPAKDVSETVNDRYLKINGQENGIKSYGDMVDLMIGEYMKNNS